MANETLIDAINDTVIGLEEADQELVFDFAKMLETRAGVSGDANADNGGDFDNENSDADGGDFDPDADADNGDFEIEADPEPIGRRRPAAAPVRNVAPRNVAPVRRPAAAPTPRGNVVPMRRPAPAPVSRNVAPVSRNVAAASDIPQFDDVDSAIDYVQGRLVVNAEDVSPARDKAGKRLADLNAFVMRAFKSKITSDRADTIAAKHGIEFLNPRGRSTEETKTARKVAQLIAAGVI